MSEETSLSQRATPCGADGISEIDLSDEDILDAMRHIPGYLDITTGDFREIYHLAHHRAVERLFRNVRAGSLMDAGVQPLLPDTRLDKAAGALAHQGRKGLPVVDAKGMVVGMLTETDFLRRLGADTFLSLLLRLLENQGSFGHRCHETPVSAAMSTPAVTVPEDAGFREIVRAFHTHEGRSMPVIDTGGRLRGLLMRKDFVKACHLEDFL